MNSPLTPRERRVRLTGMVWGAVLAILAATVALVVYGATL